MALGSAAQQLASSGYSVFPLRAGGKAPATPHGFEDASRAPERVRSWWGRDPQANIGVSCSGSAIAVLDIDTKVGADPREILAGVDRAGAPVVGTGVAPAPNAAYPRSLEGRRGVHVYFRGHLRSAGRLAIAGCEIKGAGGYVVAPPSVHPSGVEYVGQLPPVHELPEWLLICRAP